MTAMNSGNVICRSTARLPRVVVRLPRAAYYFGLRLQAQGFRSISARTRPALAVHVIEGCTGDTITQKGDAPWMGHAPERPGLVQLWLGGSSRQLPAMRGHVTSSSTLARALAMR